MRKLSTGLVVLVAFVLPATAGAQAWLEDRENSEGPGIKLGDSLVLHLGLGVEGGYDTNAFYKDEALDPDGAGRLRITPYIDLATRSGKRKEVIDEGVPDATAPKAAFRLGLATYYDHYFATSEARKNAVNQLNGLNGLGVDTHLNFVMFPEGNFSLILIAGYLRTLQPYESASDARNHHLVTPGIGFRIRPGGGTLEFELGYRLKFLYFEDPNMGMSNNHHAHDVQFETRWKLFPKTALLSRTNFTPTVYYETGGINNDSKPIRSLLGLQGLITERFGLKLLGGYGASFYSRGPNFDGMLAEGELMFYITPTSNLRLGGERDFVDSLYANFYVKYGGYVAFQQMFGGLVLGTVKGEVYYRDYITYVGTLASGVEPVPNPSERSDVFASASLALEVRATDWLSFHASGKFSADITDHEYEYLDPSTSRMTRWPAGYKKFEIFGGVRAHY
jgi:hypothetical protein